MSVYCWLCNTTVPDADAAEHAALLELQGNEIAGEGHMGWGNTMHDAAEILTADATRIASLESQISALRAALESTENYLRRGGSAVDLHVRVCKALAIPSVASIGEGGLGDAGGGS